MNQSIVEDIRDIHAPLPIPAPWWHSWQVWAALASIAVIGVWWFVKHRRLKQPSPWERAQRALEAARGYARSGQTHAWGETLAVVARETLAERFGARVLYLTTNELAKEPWATASAHQPSPKPIPTPGSAPPPTEERATLSQGRDILELLRICDLARFARASLPNETLLEHTDAAHRLIECLLAPGALQSSHQSDLHPAVPVPS